MRLKHKQTKLIRKLSPGRKIPATT
jgi:hypothetical protein